MANASWMSITTTFLPGIPDGRRDGNCQQRLSYYTRNFEAVSVSCESSSYFKMMRKSEIRNDKNDKIDELKRRNHYIYNLLLKKTTLIRKRIARYII